MNLVIHPTTLNFTNQERTLSATIAVIYSDLSIQVDVRIGEDLHAINIEDGRLFHQEIKEQFSLLFSEFTKAILLHDEAH